MSGLHGDAAAAGARPAVNGVSNANLAAVADQRTTPWLLVGVHNGGPRAPGSVLAGEAGQLELGAGFLLVVLINSDREPIGVALGVVAVLFDEMLLSGLHPSHVLGVLGVKDQFATPRWVFGGLELVFLGLAEHLAPPNLGDRGAEKFAHVVVIEDSQSLCSPTL